MKHFHGATWVALAAPRRMLEVLKLGSGNFVLLRVIALAAPRRKLEVLKHGRTSFYYVCLRWQRPVESLRFSSKEDESDSNFYV